VEKVNLLHGRKRFFAVICLYTIFHSISTRVVRLIKDKNSQIISIAIKYQIVRVTISSLTLREG
jgi:hypothetical protein